MSAIRPARDFANSLLSLTLLLSACGTEAAVSGGAAPPPFAASPGTTVGQPSAALPVGVATAVAGQPASVSGVSTAAGAAGSGAIPGTTPGAIPGTEVTPPTTVAPGGADAGWCGVKQTLDARCTVCHNEQKVAGAPMSLKTFADLNAPAISDPKRKVFELVKERVHDTKRPMPPQDPLTAPQLAGIDAWVSGGAAAGADLVCASNPAPTMGTQAQEWPPKNCDAMYTVRAAPENAPNKIAAGAEVHPQTNVTAPWGTEEVQAVAWHSLNDNVKVLHHWILYGPSGEFLFGWAPGKDFNEPLPPDVGVYLPSGTMRLDMHYNNIGGAKEESDASGVEICVLKKANFRPKTATITMALSQALISIPPRATAQDVTGTCTHTGAPVRLLTASPHAHKNANHMKFTVEKKNGMSVVMYDAPFDFNEQTTYALNPPLVVEDGDRIITTCTFGNDTDRTITFGENTGNEMCFNFAMYEPKDGLGCGGGIAIPTF